MENFDWPAFVSAASAVATLYFTRSLARIEAQREAREADNDLKLHIKNRLLVAQRSPESISAEGYYLMKVVAPNRPDFILRAYEALFFERGEPAVLPPEEFVDIMEKLQPGIWKQLYHFGQ